MGQYCTKRIKPKVKKRTQKDCSVLRIPRREWESYTVDDIEEIVAFYLGAMAPSTEKVNKEVDFVQPDLAIFSLALEGKFTDISRAGVTMLGYSSKEEILKSGETRALFSPKETEKNLKRLSKDKVM